MVYSKTKTVYGTCNIKLKVVKGKNKSRLEMVNSKTRNSKLKVVKSRLEVVNSKVLIEYKVNGKKHRCPFRNSVSYGLK